MYTQIIEHQHLDFTFFVAAEVFQLLSKTTLFTSILFWKHGSSKFYTND